MPKKCVEYYQSTHKNLTFMYLCSSALVSKTSLYLNKNYNTNNNNNNNLSRHFECFYHNFCKHRIIQVLTSNIIIPKVSIYSIPITSHNRLYMYIAKKCNLKSTPITSIAICLKQCLVSPSLCFRLPKKLKTTKEFHYPILYSTFYFTKATFI